jgi:hypothetical protein
VAQKKLDVLREYPPVGKYRVRLMGATCDSNCPLGPEEAKHHEGVLDVREYVMHAVAGFTTEGIQLKGMKEIILLHETLSGIIADHSSSGPVTISVKKSLTEQFIDKTMEAIELAKQLPLERFGEHGKMHREQIQMYENLLKTARKPDLRSKEVALFKEVMTDPQYAQPERKEVQMKQCTLCQREIPALGPESGIGYKEETLCGVCLKAAQRVCPHALRKEDGVTCRDCGARPWSAGRVIKGLSLFTVKAGAGIAKVFVLYTLQAILGSAVTLGLAYFAAKKMGFLP